MDTYRKRSITTLRIAGAMLFALCFATETLAQEISTAINDASATSTIAVTEIAATTIEVPDTETPPNTVAIRRLSGVPDGILCHSSHHRFGSYGGTYQVLHVPHLHSLHQCTDLPHLRALDMGWRLADER